MSFVRGAMCAVLCVAFLLLGGCAPATPVGKWNGVMDVKGVQLAATIEFKADGTLAQTTKSPLGEMSATGTYKVDGDKLALHVNTLQLGSVQIPVPAQVADQNATFKIEGDKMTFTRDGKDVPFTRVKE